jgi:hypothetical protein
MVIPLFVVLRSDVILDDALKTKINSAIKTALSPRFVPAIRAGYADSERWVTQEFLPQFLGAFVEAAYIWQRIFRLTAQHRRSALSLRYAVRSHAWLAHEKAA